MKSEEHLNRRYNKIFLALSTIFILVSVSVITPYLLPHLKEKQREEIIVYELQKSINKLSPILNVTVLDSEGNLKNQVIKEDDLVLKNFLDFFVGLLWDPNSNDRYATLRSDTNVNGTYSIYDAPAVAGQNWASGNYPFNRVRGGAGGGLGIGNGTTTPTRYDYKLESQKEGYVQMSSVGYYMGLIAMAGSWSVTSDYNVSEAVFKLNINTNTYISHNILLFRDTFTPINVTTGDQIFVSYNIWLNNTGFTDSFGAFLQGLFNDGGTTRTFTMLDHSNTVRTFFAYHPYSSSTTSHYSYNEARIFIALGENQTISRSGYNLTAMVGSYIGASQPTHNTTAIILSASETMSGSYDVNTAGLFVLWDDINGAQRYVMFWALQFPTINAYDGYTVTVAFRLIT